MNCRIEKLEHELKATQFWLRELFLLFSFVNDEGVSDVIRERIRIIKNSSAPEGVSEFLYDQISLKRIPDIERIGNDIAEQIDNTVQNLRRINDRGDV